MEKSEKNRRLWKESWHKNNCMIMPLDCTFTSLNAFSMFKKSSTFLSIRDGDWKSNLLLHVSKKKIGKMTEKNLTSTTFKYCCMLYVWLRQKLSEYFLLNFSFWFFNVSHINEHVDETQSWMKNSPSLLHLGLKYICKDNT